MRRFQGGEEDKARLVQCLRDRRVALQVGAREFLLRRDRVPSIVIAVRLVPGRAARLAIAGHYVAPQPFAHQVPVALKFGPDEELVVQQIIAEFPRLRDQVGGVQAVVFVDQVGEDEVRETHHVYRKTLPGVALRDLFLTVLVFFCCLGPAADMFEGLEMGLDALGDVDELIGFHNCLF